MSGFKQVLSKRTKNNIHNNKLSSKILSPLLSIDFVYLKEDNKVYRVVRVFGSITDSIDINKRYLLTPIDDPTASNITKNYLEIECFPFNLKEIIQFKVSHEYYLGSGAPKPSKASKTYDGRVESVGYDPKSNVVIRFKILNNKEGTYMTLPIQHIIVENFL